VSEGRNEKAVYKDAKLFDLEIEEDEADSETFLEAKQRYEQNPVSYSHEEAGKRLGFLRPSEIVPAYSLKSLPTQHLL